MQDYIQGFKYEEEQYRLAIGNAFEYNREITGKIINSLAALHGPIHIETFIKILMVAKDHD